MAFWTLTMWSWQMRSSSAVVTPGFTWGATTCSTSAARRPATRIFSISSGVLMVMGIGELSPMWGAPWPAIARTMRHLPFASPDWVDQGRRRALKAHQVARNHPEGHNSAALRGLGSCKSATPGDTGEYTPAATARAGVLQATEVRPRKQRGGPTPEPSSPRAGAVAAASNN